MGNLTVTGSAHIIRANALRIPLAAGSVHLALSSPPYFGLRDYREGDESLEGQIGSEATPEEFLRALWAVSDEVWRVLTDDGSWFVNLGEKYSASGGHNNAGLMPTRTGEFSTRKHSQANGAYAIATRRQAPDAYVKNPDWARPKSLMCLPDAFKLGMINPAMYRDFIDPPAAGTSHPRWILRARIKPDDEFAEHVWLHVNGLPESVKDRVRNDIEYIYHFTKQEHYFAAVDEIRERQENNGHVQVAKGEAVSSNSGDRHRAFGKTPEAYNSLGKLPGSVWRIPSEPLKLPTWKVVRAGRTVQWFTGKEDDAYTLALKWMRAMGTAGGRPSLRRVTSHFAAFPTRLPELIIRGWSPSAICTACGEGRRPVVEKSEPRPVRGNLLPQSTIETQNTGRAVSVHGAKQNMVRTDEGWSFVTRDRTILGYACACTPYTDHAGAAHSRADHAAHTATETKPGLGRSSHLRSGGRQIAELGPPPNVGPRREYHLAGWTPPPTRPALVLDPFAGTGTTMLVAKALGRTGIGVDLSHSYAKVAEWRCSSGQGAKAEARTWQAAQGSLL